MTDQLILNKVTAYTVYSADDEMRSSNKGVYKDFNLASVKAVGSGWFGSNGEVRELQDVYQEQEGPNLYQVVRMGKYLDVEDEYKKRLVMSIKSKLTPEELALLDL